MQLRQSEVRSEPTPRPQATRVAAGARRRVSPAAGAYARSRGSISAGAGEVKSHTLCFRLFIRTPNSCNCYRHHGRPVRRVRFLAPRGAPPPPPGVSHIVCCLSAHPLSLPAFFCRSCKVCKCGKGECKCGKVSDAAGGSVAGGSNGTRAGYGGIFRPADHKRERGHAAAARLATSTGHAGEPPSGCAFFLSRIPTRCFHRLQDCKCTDCGSN